ncbi:PRC-barrel domain-containing protein [Tropicimonas sp. S265A]|uniref:PRC-barrel domain-containing protein n=1 Tax=Tropicimonas sp. S265A TaxID=3415134 RepID=UPI003C7B78FA
MKSLLMTTALTAGVAIAGAAAAQSNMDEPMFPNMASESDLHASDFIGMTVYATGTVQETEWDIDEVAGMQADWDNVGEINDLIITRDGEISAVLVDIGGFLGMGERQVAMNMDEIRFVSDSETEDEGDFFLVIPASQAELEEAPEYEGFAMRGDVDSEINPADDDAEMVAENDDMMGEMLAAEELAMLTTEDLTGARVYDASGEWIGEIDQLNVNTDGTITHAIVDVGGFLGLGEKPVQLPMDQLNITRHDGDELRVSVPMTEEELEGLPTWES